MQSLQIGVMGSSADLAYTEKLSAIATELGQLIAASDNTLIFGAEKDYDSLSTVASRAALAAGGRTVGVTYGRREAVFGQQPSTLIASGLERGGGREFTLVLSCDVIICIGGGSGTLNEMLVAYQASIPIVGLANTGGWSQQLSGQYLDARKRLKIMPAQNPQQAVELAIKLARARARLDRESRSAT